ncbi:hypothetical protein BC829DRAFT_54469 [Chytridium lagenaria]|nr:hypothetical protein BC829DRAFT_54469 [Chytridium lagenaria]
MRLLALSSPSSSSLPSMRMFVLTVTTTLLLALLLLQGVHAQSTQCTNPIVRREWGELSADLKRQYVAAVQALARRPLSKQTTDPATISYGDFVETHTRMAYWAHISAQFLVYHRGMLHMWDLALRTVGWYYGPIYWDWTLSSQSFIDSDIFTYFGSIGQGPNGCLKDGEFSYDKYSVSAFPPTVGRGTDTPLSDFDRIVNIDNSEPYAATCLRRCSDWSKGVLWDPMAVRDALQSAQSYDSIRNMSDARGWHASIHQVVGGFNSDETICGDMADPSWSPNDPLFWLHHGMVDKIFYRWQTLCPSFRNTYGGVLNQQDPATNGVTDADASQMMDSWPWRVSDVLDTQSGILCYTYSRSGGDLPVSPSCPGGEAGTDGVPAVPGPMVPIALPVGMDASMTAQLTWLQTVIGNLVGPAPAVNSFALASVSKGSLEPPALPNSGVIAKVGIPLINSPSSVDSYTPPTPLQKRATDSQQHAFLLRSNDDYEYERSLKPHPFPPSPAHKDLKSLIHPDFPHVEIPVPRGYHIAIGRHGRPIVVPSARPNATHVSGYGSYPRPVVDLTHPESLRRRGMMDGSIAEKARTIEAHLRDTEMRIAL